MAFQTLLPIFVYFLLGIVLRRSGIASRDHAAFVFRLVFFITLPALVFPAIAGAELTRTTMLLPVSGFSVNLVCAAAAITYVRFAGLNNRRAGAVVLGASITNMLFVFPFILSVLGQAALADAILYDLGNAMFVGTLAYSITLYFGTSQEMSKLSFLFRTIRAPIFVTIAAALLVNAYRLSVPPVVSNVLAPLGATTTPLVLIAVGMSFSTQGISGHLTVATLLLRMALGFVVGLLLSWLFGFEGFTAAVVVVGAAAPIGFSSPSLASVGVLDTAQAAAALSVSVAIGVFTTTALLLVAARWFGA